MSSLIEEPSFTRRLVDGEDRDRLVCDSCGFIDYENPKIVVGSVVDVGGRLLLCRRAIEPRRSFWTIPAGFLEEHETTEDGARREAMEEANARIELRALLAIYNVPRISQVQLIYLARLPEPVFSPGPESEDVRLFGWDEIPWDELAFPSVHWALHHYAAIRDKALFQPFTNPTGETGDRMPQGL